MKAAEADADSKYLSGVGIARQRKAIVEGLRDSVMHFSESVEGTNAKDVMDLVLVTQYVCVNTDRNHLRLLFSSVLSSLNHFSTHTNFHNLYIYVQ